MHDPHMQHVHFQPTSTLGSVLTVAFSCLSNSTMQCVVFGKGIPRHCMNNARQQALVLQRHTTVVTNTKYVETMKGEVHRKCRGKYQYIKLSAKTGHVRYDFGVHQPVTIIVSHCRYR